MIFCFVCYRKQKCGNGFNLETQKLLMVLNLNFNCQKLLILKVLSRFRSMLSFELKVPINWCVRAELVFLLIN